MLSTLTVVVIIVDNDRRWLLLSNAMSPISLEFRTKLSGADVIEVNNYNSFFVFGFNFL